MTFSTSTTMKNLFYLLLVFTTAQASAQQTSILFLGNSYTYTSNLPGTLYNLALAGGDTIYHESNTPGGYTLEGHSTNNATLTKIASRDWDFVVMQEQSQRPSFPPSQVASQVYPFAEILVDSIKSNYECTEPIFFMTWGRRDGDQNNCQFYTPLCTFEGMNARLRESYLEMGSDNDATVAPCGAAWHQMKLENNTFWTGLYSSDGSHPSAWGTYLNACVFYATIFRQSPVGIPYYASIGQQDAEDLQQLAEDIVLDSLGTWYIGHQDVVSDASFTSNGLTVDFDGSSVNATSHFWDFDDGNTSSDMSPQHIYVSPNTYQVIHVASSNCDSDTTYLQVNVTSTDINDERNTLSDIQVATNGNLLNITNTLSYKIEVSVLDVSGRVVLTEIVSANESGTCKLPSGAGVYLVSLSDGRNLTTRKVFIP